MERFKFSCPECRSQVEIFNQNLKRTICSNCGKTIWVIPDKLIAVNPHPTNDATSSEQINHMTDEQISATMQEAEQEAAELEARDALAMQQNFPQQNMPLQDATPRVAKYDRISRKPTATKQPPSGQKKPNSSPYVALWVSIGVFLFLARACFSIMEAVDEETRGPRFDPSNIRIPQIQHPQFDPNKFQLPPIDPKEFQLPDNPKPTMPDWNKKINPNSNPLIDQLEQDMYDEEEVPNIQDIQTIERTNFRVAFPNNWQENEEYQDSETQLYLESSTGITWCKIIFADSQMECDVILNKFLDQHNISDTQNYTKVNWGKYATIAYNTQSNVIIRRDISIFQYKGDEGNFVVIQSQYNKLTEKVKPAFDLISCSFALLE